MPESAASEHAALEGTELEVVGSGAEEADAEGESSDERAAGADAGPAVESNVVTAFGTAGAPEEDREPAGGDDDDRVSETREEAAGQADEAEPDDTDEAGDSSQVGAAGPRIERSG